MRFPFAWPRSGRDGGMDCACGGHSDRGLCLLRGGVCKKHAVRKADIQALGCVILTGPTLWTRGMFIFAYIHIVASGSSDRRDKAGSGDTACDPVSEPGIALSVQRPSLTETHG